MKNFIILNLIFIFYIKNVYGDYQLERTLSGHTGIANRFVELSNGLIASGSSDRTIRIWNPNTGLTVQNFTLHSSQISSMVELNNGLIASVSVGSGLIRIWNYTNGVQIGSLSNHTSTVNELVLLRNGNLASAGSDQTIKIWNVTTGELLYDMFEGTGSVNKLILLDNNKLASGAFSGQVKIWNGANGQLIYNLTNHSSQIFSLGYLKDNLLASGSADKTIKIWDLNQGTLNYTLSGHSSAVRNLVVLKNNSNFASIANDNSLRIWNPYTGESIYNLTSSSNFVSLDNGLLAAADFTIKIWNPYTGQKIQEINNRGYYVDGLLKLSNGRFLSSAGFNISIWIDNLVSSGSGSNSVTTTNTLFTVNPNTSQTTFLGNFTNPSNSSSISKFKQYNFFKITLLISTILYLF